MELITLYPRWFTHSSAEGFLGASGSAINILRALKLSLLHHGCLVDLFGVDKGHHGIEVNWILWSYEFEIVYKLRQLSFSLQTSTWLWTTANWLEREAWEMFGVTFYNHPDLRRLLTDYGFKSYPLLKSYPLSGYHQLYYSEKNKRVTAQPVFLAQEFREFDFKSPWLK